MATDHAQAVEARKAAMEDREQAEAALHIDELQRQLALAEQRKQEQTNRRLSDIAGDHSEQVAERHNELNEAKEQELDEETRGLRLRLHQAQRRREELMAGKVATLCSMDHSEAVRVNQEQQRELEEVQMLERRKRQEEKHKHAESKHQAFLAERQMKAMLMD